MKPDGVTMETMEPTEAAAGAEPSLSQGAATQEEVTEQAQSASQPDKAACTTVPPAAQEANDKPAAADSKAKPQAVAPKVKLAAKTAGDSGSKSRPGSAPNRTVNGVKPTNSVPPRTTTAKKTTTTTTGASATGAVPKRPVGVSVASSTVRTQTKVPEKKPVGPVKATSAAAAVTNGTKPTTANGTPKRPATGPVNGARPKTTAPASRPAASTATKPSNSTAARPDRTAVSKTSRPATSTASRFASTTSRPTTAGAGTTAATAKPPTTGTAKAAAARVTTAPSAGRTTAVQPPKNNAVAKKDVSRPASATTAKKPTTATTSAATKKPEPSKTTATLKPDAASKRPIPTKAADPKMSRPKTQEPPKPTPTKKAAPPTARLTALNKPPLGRNPPASPASKPAASSTAQTKRGPKPTQAVQPFTATKKTGAPNSATAAERPSAAAIATTATAVVAATTAVAAAAAILAEQTEAPAETQAEAVLVSPEATLHPAEEAPSPALAQDTPAEMVLQEAVQGDVTAPSPPQSPVRTAVPPTCPDQDLVESITPALTAQEQISAPAEAALPTMPSPPALSEDHVLLALDQNPSTSKAPPLTVSATLQVVSSSNLSEEDDEEEREGSQQVSVSEMSGTTQPTEESRPGSAGPLGGSAWRVGGALLSELDSEEVSGSQQGASELSAPGVLEGTESMDDLGDASLKGAIDMEGASAGSPDFEKVPDIPVNDFEEDEDDDEDDEDRVCDMDVGSERADDLQRPRHDNEVDDEEEDEDVEMASEGVTESGLESYGNADEDDFAEDERLDNLNRVAQPPPPPPLLPSAPAAQWDQPNPFADPWAQPIQLLQPQPPFEHISQPLQAAAASPSTDPWQADSETPTQSPAQAWLELGSAPYIPQNQDISHHSSGQAEPQKPEAQTYMDQSNSTPMQTLAPAPLSAPGMSLSSTLSSETSTPEELCEYNREGKLQLPSQGSQAPMLSLQPDPEDQDLGIHLERGDREGEEEGEAETLPADEVLGGPATAPTSNPSSSSTTEDEASDTEGEAQLDDPLDGQGINNITFDGQPSTQRSLSAVDEGEEEGGVGGDATPPSANSAASYGFDTMTTASNSNAQSTGESCTKSPGIFSLEELPEEAKEPCIIMEPPAQPCPTEQHYMQCGKQEADTAEDAGVELSGSEEASAPSLLHLQQPEGDPDDSQPPYYSAICEKTENSFAGNV
ncbi:mucin-5AC-like [Myripristis murdjan]|uniref:mucin-5AC-like n=1 Tax=Myripristis murdjan TaxID=586833 RepID=UPI001175E4CF|nr:mucin-5AC-like [Myripristis murdjan]